MYTKSTKIANTVKTVFQQDSEIEENEGPINPVKIVKITDAAVTKNCALRLAESIVLSITFFLSSYIRRTSTIP